MKINYILLIILSAILISCAEDRRKEYAIERTDPNNWMYTEMSDLYYWYEDIPESSELNYYMLPNLFFPKLLSSKDGKSSNPYSRIVEKNATETRITLSSIERSYGFEYGVVKHSVSKLAALLVLYTTENSPAANAGLSRGDLIMKIGETFVTDKNYNTLLSGEALSLGIGYFDEEEGKQKVTETKQLSSKVEIEKNPIYYSDVIQIAGKTVGYLVYNSFTSGKDENNTNDIVYLQQLAALSNEYKNAGVNEFILDLRYNPGGELNRPVPLLCTMLAPASAMESLMGYLSYNDKNQHKNWEINFSANHLMGGSNLDLQRVFILTTNNTASASEAVINFLKPYMEVVLIGTTTVGKNVGSEKIESDEYSWILHPIVCKLHNSEDFSEYSSGFTPDFIINETSDMSKFLPFGDPNEALLSAALGVIDGSYPPEEEPDEETEEGTEEENTRSKKHQSAVYELTGSSLERKSLPGCIIR